MKIIADLIEHYDRTFEAIKFEYPPGQLDQILSFDDFKDLIKTSRFVENDIVLYKNGTALPNQDLMVSRENRANPWLNSKRFSNKKLNHFFENQKIGIKINSIYDFSEKINTFRKVLAQTLMCQVSVNSYYSPKGSEKMLTPHRDSYNILVLQIEGKKKFYFGEMTDEKISADKTSVTLSAGEGLYLPANLAHYAEPAEGENSLHLTLGLHDLLFSDYVSYIRGRTHDWQLVANKKFPVHLSGEPNFDELSHLIDQFAEGFKEQLKDKKNLEIFLKDNLKFDSDI